MSGALTDPGSAGGRRPRGRFLWAALATVFLVCACRPSGHSDPLAPVTVQLKWVHQAQFAGFYVALDEGMYAAEGLDVTLRAGGPGIDVLGELKAGRADFAVSIPEEILAHPASEGAPLAVATLFRRSPLLFVTLAGSGIIRPQDFAGRTVQLADDHRLTFRAMLGRQGIDPQAVRELPFDYAYSGFAEGQPQITGTYSIGGLLRLASRGIEVHRIWPDDYGVHFHADTLVTTRRLCDSHPDRVIRFLRATLAGWKRAVEDPERAVEAILARAERPDRDLQVAMMRGVIPLVYTGQGRLGAMDPAVWEATAEALRKYSSVETVRQPEAAYSLRFLEEAYAGAER